MFNVRVRTMDKRVLSDYLIALEGLSDKEYLLATIAYHVAPTIERIKPSTIITLNNGKRKLYTLWEKYKFNFINYYGLNYCELSKGDDKTTLLFYDAKLLSDILSIDENIEFLKKFGYSNDMTLYEALNFLKLRFAYSFPHEIGVFLGFPLEDVKQFIEHPTKDCIFYGYWKVYTNLERAKMWFDLYDRAKLKVINNLLRESYLS
jgi:hypothetical protein